MSEIRKTISEYMRGKTEPTEHDLQCFVGMIGTGEATLVDFEAVGGVELSKAVNHACGVATDHFAN